MATFVYASSQGQRTHCARTNTQPTRQSPTTPGAVAWYAVIPIGNNNVSQINSCNLGTTVGDDVLDDEEITSRMESKLDELRMK